MPTARSSGHPGGGLHQAPAGADTPLGPGTPPPMDRITDACKNITLPQLHRRRDNDFVFLPSATTVAERLFSQVSVCPWGDVYTPHAHPWQTPPHQTATAVDGTHSTGMHSCYRPQQSCGQGYYRPQRSCGQGYVFTRVCDSVHRGGICLSACWDTTPLEQTSPRNRRPPWSRHPPESRLQHTVNERPVRILLECILVLKKANGLQCWDKLSELL